MGLGETYLAAFALAMGMGEWTAGLVGSVPMLAGGMMQLVSPWVIRRLRSHKWWVVACCAVQAAAFFPLAIAALTVRLTAVELLTLASLYWGAGLAAGPAWNTWIGTVVPKRLRASFFSARTRASQAAVFLGFLAAGIALQVADVYGTVLVTYAAIFCIAGMLRLVSAWFLIQQSEPQPVPLHGDRVRWRLLGSLLRDHRGGRLLVYLIVVQCSLQIAGPYFTPFMFEKLSLAYSQFVCLIAAAFLSKVLVLPAWGRVAQRIGAWRLLWVGGMAITPLSAAWLLSQSFYWLLVVQIGSGMAWAAYELAFFLLFFESIDEQDRVPLLTIYNLLNSLAWIIGAAIGGSILWALDFQFHAYLLVFALSSLGRGAALVLLARISPRDVIAGQVALRPLAVRPNGASLDAPVLPSLPDQTEEGLAPATKVRTIADDDRAMTSPAPETPITPVDEPPPLGGQASTRRSGRSRHLS